MGNNGPEVLPGTYRIKVAYGDLEKETTVEVLADPRFTIARGDRESKRAAIQRAGALQEIISRAIVRILDTRADLERVLGHADRLADDADDADKEEDPYKSLRQAAESLQDSLTTMEKRLRVPPGTRGIIADDDALSQVRSLISFLSSSWDAPTVAQRQRLQTVAAGVEQALDDFNHLYDNEVNEFRRKVSSSGLVLFAEQEPLQVKR
jgi:hypothetical protein